MNPELPTNPEAEREARLTAYLLGELPAHEAAAVRQELDDNPDLAQLCDRLKPAIKLVREIAGPAQAATDQSSEPLKLSEERRQKLLAHFKTVRPKEFAPAPTRSVWPIAIAACVAMLLGFGYLMLPALARSKSKSNTFAVLSQLRQLDGAKQSWAAENKKSASDVPTFKDIEPYMGRGNSSEPAPVAGGKYILGKVGESPTVELPASKAKKFFGVTTAGKGSDLVQVDVNGKLALADSQQSVTTVGNGQFAATETKSDGEFVKPQGLTPLPARRTTIVLPATPELATASPAPAQDERKTFGFDLGLPKDRISDNAGSFGGAGGGGAGGNLEKVPLLGDVPVIGHLQQGLAPIVAQTAAPASSVDILNAPTAMPPPPITDIGSGAGIAANGVERDASTEKYSPQIVGYVNVPVQQGVSVVTNSASPEAQSDNPMLSIQGITASTSTSENSVQWRTNGIDPRNPLLLRSQQRLALGIDSAHTDGTYSISGQSPASTTLEALPSAPSLVFDSGGFVQSRDVTRAGTLAQQSAAKQQLEANYSLRSLAEGAAEKTSKSEAENVSNGASQFASDDFKVTSGERKPQLIAGLDRAYAEKLDRTFSAGEKSDGFSQKANLDSAYKAKQQELVMLNEEHDALSLKITRERLSKIVSRASTSAESVAEIPKSEGASIVDPANANTVPAEGFGKKLSEALTGKVERMARVRAEQNLSSPQLVDGQRTITPVYDPGFVQSQYEVIGSEVVLDGVIDKLDLKKAWAKNGKPLAEADARAMLKKNLDVHGDENANVVDIGFKSEKPEEAAKVANAVAESYLKFREYQVGQSYILYQAQEQKQLADTDTAIKRATGELAMLQKKSETAAVAAKAQVVNPETDQALAKPASPIPTPQPEVLTRENAFSTFSMNVSDVSFKLAAATLEKGQMPDPASIRSEEFINAFDYRDPDPAPGAPLGFASERALYPFAHNRDLLRFSVKTAAAGRPPGRAMNIVLLLDNSGSMERADRVQIIHEALRVLASQLQPQDIISVVTFARTAHLWVDGASGAQAGEVAEKVSGLTPQGGTNLEEAMKLAYETALRHYLANGLNRVVLLTDGAANLGNVDPIALKQKVEENRKQGIAFDCFGVGWEGYNDDLLETLSRNGDGRYGFLNTPEQAATEFAGQLAGAFNPAASDVKVQVEFNPQRVTAYRQMGYAKHQLTKEQFRDNSVNAAQIGAAESGNALYVIATDPNGSGPVATVRVRFRVPGTTDYQEHAWEVPYTANAPTLQYSSPAMRLAGTAGAFSEWLSTSPYGVEATPEQLLYLISGVPQVYGADTRPAKLEWMLRQAKSVRSSGTTGGVTGRGF